jgi:hypothetical protein
MAQSPSLGINYRVTHKDDIVPNNPTTAGYVHISPSYYISSGNTIPPTPSDIDVQEGTNITIPSDGLSDAQAAHDFYFNKISSCYPSACEICIPWKA